MKIKIKPCPFCGATPVLTPYGRGAKPSAWDVQCKNRKCLITPGTYLERSYKTAVWHWNRRADSDHSPSMPMEVETYEGI